MPDSQHKLPTDKAIILFDGVCNFCDGTVNFLIRNDKNDNLRFAPLQSEVAKRILAHADEDIKKSDSIILYEPGGKIYAKSAAAIRIGQSLGGVYRLMGIFSLLPAWISDRVYDYVARNRYQWYGKKDECMVPSLEVRNKFLS